MYRVCFVDDEVKNYQLFEKLVDWKEKGFEIVGTAADGLEALQKYEELHPDLIFMDIQLPMMDGLECIRCIRQEDKEVQIVIVSAYGEFTYAQKAIQYGVQDFLLKPISRIMLNQVVDKMKQILDEKQKTETEPDYFHNQLSSEILQLVRCAGAEHGKEAMQDPKLPEGAALCRIFLKKNEGSVQEEIIKELIENIPDKDQILGIALTADSCYLVSRDESGERRIEREISQKLAEAGCITESYLWSTDAGADEKKLFWKNDSEFENYGFYTEEPVHYLLSDYPFAEYEIDAERLDMLIIKGVAENQFQELMDFVDGTFSKAQQCLLNPKILKNYTLDVLLKIKFILKKFDAKESFHILRNVRTEKIYQVYKAGDLQRYLRDKITEVSACLNQKNPQKQRGGSVILQANALAELYFGRQDFSAQEVADTIGISKNYFISIYKEQTGTGFWEYVTKLRMDKAKELLMLTDETITGIALQIGYESEYYFSRKFKEYVGKSPKQYRHQDI